MGSLGLVTPFSYCYFMLESFATPTPISAASLGFFLGRCFLSLLFFGGERITAPRGVQPISLYQPYPPSLLWYVFEAHFPLLVL